MTWWTVLLIAWLATPWLLMAFAGWLYTREKMRNRKASRELMADLDKWTAEWMGEK